MKADLLLHLMRLLIVPQEQIARTGNCAALVITVSENVIIDDLITDRKSAATNQQTARSNAPVDRPRTSVKSTLWGYRRQKVRKASSVIHLAFQASRQEVHECD